MIEKTQTISSYGVIIIRSKVQGKRFTDIVEIGGTKYIEFAITDPGDIVFFIGIIFITDFPLQFLPTGLLK